MRTIISLGVTHPIGCDTMKRIVHVFFQPMSFFNPWMAVSSPSLFTLIGSLEVRQVERRDWLKLDDRDSLDNWASPKHGLLASITWDLVIVLIHVCTKYEADKCNSSLPAVVPFQQRSQEFRWDGKSGFFPRCWQLHDRKFTKWTRLLSTFRNLDVGPGQELPCLLVEENPRKPPFSLSL